MAEPGFPGELTAWTPTASIEEARARARARFKERLESGAEVGGCGCEDEDPIRGIEENSPPVCVVGVRFRDSGRVYYFQADSENLSVGDWIVVPTNRGQEAGRVVIAPHQVRRALLQGEIGRVSRRLSDEEVRRTTSYRRLGGEAVRVFGERSRQRGLAIKPIAAEYSFDGAAVTLSYAVPDRERAPDAGALRELARVLASEYGCRVELRLVGPRDEARLLGGLGRCGRTLCCSSWLPVFPEISMSMAKNQELPLNPSKVSGVCGRLLCCLSYENDQYRQMKAVMPKLGQPIETPGGSGMVISIHLLKELVTVRLDGGGEEVTFRVEELGIGFRRDLPGQLPVRASISSGTPDAPAVEDVEGARADETTAPTAPRRRRRRRGKGRGGS
jgi:cell fate regulator YaaT (PSP1 superfamily)